MRTTQLPLLAMYLVRLVHTADTSQNRFIKPPAAESFQDYSLNPLYNANSTIAIQWKTSYTDYDVVISQLMSSGPGLMNQTACYPQNVTNRDISSCQWNLRDHDFNLTLSSVFVLSLNPRDGSKGFTSRSFNISSSSDQLSPTRSSLFHKTNTTGASLSSAYSSFVASPHPGLDVGIGAGVGVGVPIVLVVGVWLGYKMVKGRRASKETDAERDPLAPHNTYHGNNWPPAADVPIAEPVMVQSRNIYEAPVDNWVHEAPDGPTTPVRPDHRNPSVEDG